MTKDQRDILVHLAGLRWLAPEVRAACFAAVEEIDDLRARPGVPDVGGRWWDRGGSDIPSTQGVAASKSESTP